MLCGLRGAAGALREQMKIDDGVVGERIGFEPGPQVFERIEFGGVRRQVFQVGRTGRQALIDRRALVNPSAVPDQHEGRLQLPLQMLEEPHGALGVDVGLRMQAEIQSDPVACGRDAQRGDGGHLLMAATPLAQYGSLSPRAPGATHQRGHEHPRLVEEHECRTQARGVFFTRGQSCSIQARMRCSSRSTARRVGFWGENPSPCRSRLTCAG